MRRVSVRTAARSAADARIDSRSCSSCVITGSHRSNDPLRTSRMMCMQPSTNDDAPTVAALPCRVCATRCTVSPSSRATASRRAASLTAVSCRKRGSTCAASPGVARASSLRRCSSTSAPGSRRGSAGGGAFSSAWCASLPRKKSSNTPNSSTAVATMNRIAWTVITHNSLGLSGSARPDRRARSSRQSYPEADRRGSGRARVGAWGA